MKLMGVEKRNGYLYAEWALTYRVGWDRIVNAAALIYRYTKDPEVFVGDADGEKAITVNSPEEILEIEEYGYLTIRGESEIIGVPIMITFYNQSDYVRQSVISTTDEFKESDYEKFNLSMCQYMDSVEIAMYS
jgi:hypothetical protein